MAHHVRASIVYEIENLDDLFDAYYLGRMDYSTFSTLYDAYNFGGLKIDDVESLNLADPIELNLIEKRTGTTDFWAQLLSDEHGKLGARRYSRNLRYISTDYYFYYSFRPARIICNIRENNNGYDFRRRSVSFSDKQNEISLGHYLANEGYGLIIGRYDYRPLSSETEDDGLDFWTPVNNYYNGLKVVYEKQYFSGRLYYSRKGYANNDKSFIGLAGGLLSETVSINMAAGLNEYETELGRDDRLALGINFKYTAKDYALGGEYAAVGKSGGLYLRGVRYFTEWRIETGFWHYAEQFKNYNCSGPASSDYEIFQPAGDSLAFRSIQAGETGTSVSYSASMFSVGMQLWNNQPDRDLNSSLYARYRRDIDENLKAHLQASYRNVADGDYFWSKLFLVSDYWLIDRLGVKSYFTKNVLSKSRSYLFSDIKYVLNENLRFDFRIRCSFDGDLYWLLRESFTPVADLIIRGEFSYDRYVRINLRVEKSL